MQFFRETLDKQISSSIVYPIIMQPSLNGLINMENSASWQGVFSQTLPSRTRLGQNKTKPKGNIMFDDYRPNLASKNVSISRKDM